jgi:hypothetical protein
MFMFQDEKDELKQSLVGILRDIERLRSSMEHQVDVLTKRLDSLTHPHGAKKDGSPRAKPGRKPRGVKA